MGNQCCGNQPIPQNEMAFSHSIPVSLTAKLKAQSSRLYQVSNSKDEQQDENQFFASDRKEEFILTIKPYSHLESHDSISIELTVKTHDFSYKSDMDWKIDEDIVVDPNNFDTSLLRAVQKKTGDKFTLKVVNFDDYDDYQFKAALYQIYIMHQVKDKPNIAQLHDCYILENDEKDTHKGSIVMLFDYCDSSLHEIISFRKFHKWPWTQDEIANVFVDLATAIGSLEESNITHRDIRPHNIWYSSKHQKYLLGGFEDAKIIKRSQIDNQQLGKKFLRLQFIGIQPVNQESEELLNTIRGVPDFLPPEVSKYVQDSSQTVGKYNPFLSDVYQLGLCTVMMQFLEVSHESPDLRNYVNKFKKSKGGSNRLGSKSYQELLQMMLVGDEKNRLTPAELSLFVRSLNYNQMVVNEDNVLKSMKFKKKMVGIDTTKVYQLIAMAYYDLFEWDKWHEKMEEILVTYEAQKDDENQAAVLYDIANGFMEINNVHSAQDYYMRASVLHNEIGHQQRKDGNLQEAIESYQISLDCIRKAHNGEDSYEGALMLENLGNVYRLKGEIRKSRSYMEEALRIAEQEKGQDSLETAKILINLGKIYVVMNDLKHADKRIKRAINITNSFPQQHHSDLLSSSMNQSSNQQNQGLLLKAMALGGKGEVLRLKGKLDKAKKCLEEALQIRQQIQGSGHVEVASTLENLGNVYFEIEDYHVAKSYYEKALVIKKNKLGEIHSEVALTLNNLGNSCKNLGEVEKAQKMFTDALAILSKNSEESCLLGTTYGNLGILLKESGNQAGGEHCLNKCIEILQRFPENNDIGFYQQQLQQVPQ